jgi:hypothetical protein
VTRPRLGWAAALAAGLALATGAAAAAGGARTPTPLKGSVKIAFQGEGRQVLEDYKQWIFQADQECYYDRDVAQSADFRWATSFASLSLTRLAKPSPRTLSGAEASADGRASGQEVRGDCDSDDVPPGWVQTIPCDQELQFGGPGSLRVVRGKPGSAALLLKAPAPSLQSPSTCSLILRSTELQAVIKLDLGKLAKLPSGKSMTVRTRAFRSEVNCSTHPAPYEGTQILDDCHDTLTWRGTVTLTRR